MRYGLQFADGDPFPQDVEVGILLDDEEPIPVPEDCPECPEGGDCEVSCSGWDMHQVLAGFLVQVWEFSNRLESSGVVGTEVLVRYQANRAYTFIPIGNWCGHAIRIVVTPGTWDTHEIHYSPSSGNATSVLIIFHAATSNSGKTGTVKVQIDLTDAAPGFETWTDICATIRLTAPIGR